MYIIAVHGNESQWFFFLFRFMRKCTHNLIIVNAFFTFLETTFLSRNFPLLRNESMRGKSIRRMVIWDSLRVPRWRFRLGNSAQPRTLLATRNESFHVLTILAFLALPLDFRIRNLNDLRFAALSRCVILIARYLSCVYLSCI